LVRIEFLRESVWAVRVLADGVLKVRINAQQLALAGRDGRRFIAHAFATGLTGREDGECHLGQMSKTMAVVVHPV